MTEMTCVSMRAMTTSFPSGVLTGKTSDHIRIPVVSLSLPPLQAKSAFKNLLYIEKVLPKPPIKTKSATKKCLQNPPINTKSAKKNLLYKQKVLEKPPLQTKSA